MQLTDCSSGAGHFAETIVDGSPETRLPGGEQLCGVEVELSAERMDLIHGAHACGLFEKAVGDGESAGREFFAGGGVVEGFGVGEHAVAIEDHCVDHDYNFYAFCSKRIGIAAELLLPAARCSLSIQLMPLRCNGFRVGCYAAA